MYQITPDIMLIQNVSYVWVDRNGVASLSVTNKQPIQTLDFI